MELTQEKLKTGIKNQMQHFLEYVYLSGQLDPYGSGDIRMQDDAKTMLKLHACATVVQNIL